MEEAPLALVVALADLFTVFVTPVLAGNSVEGVDEDDANADWLERSFIVARAFRTLNTLLRLLIRSEKKADRSIVL